ALTASIVEAPTHGSVTWQLDGSFGYTPAANYHGTDSFTYILNDDTIDSDSAATVSITITSVNDLPVAVNDSYTTNEDTDLVVAVDTGVVANDTDVDGD